MEKQTISNVWFADEKRNRSLIKGIVFDSKGSLEIGQGFLEFKGIRIQTSKINQISIIRQQVPWISFLIMNALMLIGFAVIVREVLGFLLLLIPVILSADALGFIIAHSTKWIKIEFTDENNNICFAFFADSSFLGWGGIFGGTEKLFRAVKPVYLAVSKS